MIDRTTYQSEFTKRYSSEKMRHIFSDDNRYSLWRKLWVALAESEKELGLDISEKQIDQMRLMINDIDYALVDKYEREVKHDVMAHVHAFGDQVPAAKGIIHLGATSCYVADNAELIMMKEAMGLLRSKLVSVLSELSKFAIKYKDLPTLGYTHYQAAQPTTVGKRAAMWMQDIATDIEELEIRIDSLAFRGAKGTTGTQDSFLHLFDGEAAKVFELDRMIAQKMGFSKVLPISGQTYTRKIDSMIISTLAGIAESAAKFSNDIRLLQHDKEIEEPYARNQIGSSAMPYKRNPMRSERIGALARFVITNQVNSSFTTASQWLERTLDDSANRRLVIGQTFLACDEILSVYANIASGLVVNEVVIARNLARELPFLASEAILMQAVKKGGDRQNLHERIRMHSNAAGERIKKHGAENDFIERVSNDEAFLLNKEEIREILSAGKFVGLAAEQVESYSREYVEPILEKYKSEIQGQNEFAF